MSTERFTFPVMDHERIRRRRRQQALRRQAPAPEPTSPDDSLTDGIESESSEDETLTGPSAQAPTQPPLPPTSSLDATRVIPTLTAILPPAQATLLTGSSSSRQITTLTAILPPAQATLLSSGSVTASTPSLDLNTSIQGNRNEPPPPPPTSVPESSSATSNSSTTTPVSTPSPDPLAPPLAIQPSGGPTSTLMVSTTATTFVSSSSSAAPTTRVATPANALGETNDARVSGVPAKDNGLTKGVETVIIVVSVGAVFAVLVYVGIMLLRKLQRRKLEEASSRTNNTRSIWGGSNDQGSSSGAPQMSAMPINGPLPTYIPPVARQVAPAPETNPFADPDPFVDPDPDRRRSALTNNAVDRQERLGRVRADLLAPRELTGNLMRSATQRDRNMPEPNGGHIRNASGNNIASNQTNQTASSGVFPLDVVDRSWPSYKVEAGTIPPDQRLNIEAGGQWDDSATVARYSMTETEKSMPHWRTPSQWVSDQAKRNHGMNRLPG